MLLKEDKMLDLPEAMFFAKLGVKKKKNKTGLPERIKPTDREQR